MKFLLLIFAHVLSAAEVVKDASLSSIFIYFLCSNGYASPSESIASQLCSSSKNGFNNRKELVQILINARESTRLILPFGKDVSTFEVDYKIIDLIGYRGVLELLTILNFHQIRFQRSNDLVVSNFDKPFRRLYWEKKGLSFLLSIKPFKDKALNIVLQSLETKVSDVFKEYQEKLPDIPAYSMQILDEYQTGCKPASLLPLDAKWASINLIAMPKIHYVLLSELHKRNVVKTKFITSCKSSYLESYERIIEGGKCMATSLDSEVIPTAIHNHIDQLYSIINEWLALWSVGMRLRRAMPSPSNSALGPGLIESFNMEVKAMELIVQIRDVCERQCALEFSCLHVSYLIECMRFALLFNLLKPQDHDKCIDLIACHRELATGMVDNL